jgi:GAF domain-containing protein
MPESDSMSVPNIQTDDPVAMVENLVRLAAQGVGSSSASFYTVRDGALYPWYVYGLPKEYIAACGAVQIGEQCCGRAVAHRKPWVVANMLTDPDWTHLQAEVAKTEIRAAFSVPVMLDEKCIGSLACHFKRPYQPNQDAIQRNQTFATLIAFAFRRFPGELTLTPPQSLAG